MALDFAKNMENFNSWAEIRKKRYIYVILNMVVACSIHSTAIIFLIAFIFYLCKDKPKILRVLLVSGIVLAVNYQSFIVIVSHYLTKYGILNIFKKEHIQLGK